LKKKNRKKRNYMILLDRDPTNCCGAGVVRPPVRADQVGVHECPFKATLWHITIVSKTFSHDHNRKIYTLTTLNATKIETRRHFLTDNQQKHDYNNLICVNFFIFCLRSIIKPKASIFVRTETFRKKHNLFLAHIITSSSCSSWALYLIMVEIYVE
jgi:hypothetical protein